MKKLKYEIDSLVGNKILEFYHSLGLSGEWEEERILFLVAIQKYIMSIGKNVTPRKLTIVLSTNFLDIIKNLNSVDSCLKILNNSPLSILFIKNDWVTLENMMSELKLKLMDLYPGYKDVSPEYNMLDRSHWKKKTTFIKGLSDDILRDTDTVKAIEELMGKRDNNKVLARNMIVIGSLDVVETVVEKCIPNPKNVLYYSTRNTEQSVRMNPFACQELYNFHISRWGTSIATSLIGGRTNDKKIDIMAEHIVSACITYLYKRKELTLHALFDLLKNPFSVLSLKLAYFEDAMIYIPKNVDTTITSKAMDLLKRGIEAADTPALRYLTDDDGVNPDIWKSGYNILQMPVAERPDEVLLNNLMIESFLQKMDEMILRDYNLVNPVARPNNLIIITDISNVRINKMETYISLPRTNPFHLIIGFKEIDDIYKYHERDKMEEYITINKYCLGHWKATNQ